MRMQAPCRIVGAVLPPVVDFVIPVYNEAAGLEHSVRRLHAYLLDTRRLDWQITIVDNASTDETFEIATRLREALRATRAVHLDRKGRGYALRSAWLASDAEVVAYMDVDLSTCLTAITPLIEPLVRGDADIAIGSRLADGARVTRGPRRELISRTYNAILRTVMGARFSDAQCGFKAVRRDVASVLLPLVEDNDWFFDTELLLLAQHNGLRLHEVAVNWVEDPDSRVKVIPTAIQDLRGLSRMKRRFRCGEAQMQPAPRPLAKSLVPAPGRQ